MTRLSDDKDVVEDVGSELESSKRCGGGSWQSGQTPVEGAVAVADGDRTVSSVDETGWEVVEQVGPPALDAGDGSDVGGCRQ